MSKHITTGSVFDDLGFSPDEAANLKIRVQLMQQVEAVLLAKKLTQVQAADLLDVTQPRISDLLRGKIQLFTIDMLVNMLAKLGKPVRFVSDDKDAA